MEVLTNEVITWLKTNGASIAGISNVERFEGAPKGHHPCDFVPGARSVITFGVAVLHQSLYWEKHLANSELVPAEHRQDILQNYLFMQTGYIIPNTLLDGMALRIANFLESQGYLSLFFPSTYSYEEDEFIQQRIPFGLGLFSQRHAAVRAGLGEFGLNNVVVTPQYGPRVRLNSVITEAELTPSPLLKEKVCLGESCSLCLQDCPGAISLRPDFDPEAVWYNTPARTDIRACEKLDLVHYCRGRCVKICPVAQKS